jgi:hypothetical protein
MRFTLETFWIFGGLYANKEEGKLVLYAEMKLPGQAWLNSK